MHEIYELKEKLMKELEEYGQQELSAGSLQTIDTLAHAIKNLCKIVESMEEEEYSMRGGSSYARDGRSSYRYSREGSSYAGEGSSYARGRRGNVRRDSMGRYARTGGYSRADGMEELMEEIQGMMGELPPSIQHDAQRLVHKIEQEM